MSIFGFAHQVPAVGLRCSTKITIGLNLSLGGLSMDASSCVPRVLSLHILDSVNEVIASWLLTLSKVLASTEDVRGYCLLILNDLLDDHCLGELLLVSLCVESKGSTVEHLLLSISKSMVLCVKLPVVVSVLLLTRGKVAMSFLVHFDNILSIGVGASCWVDHVFSVLKASARETKLVGGVLSLLRPVISTLEGFAEGLLRVGSILTLLNVIELVLHALQVVRLYNLTKWLGTVAALSIRVALGEASRVVGHTIVLLNHTWLVHV